jgi:hypothetical protein
MKNMKKKKKSRFCPKQIKPKNQLTDTGFGSTGRINS